MQETDSSLKSSTGAPGASSVVFNINDYGARGNGKHDASPALAKAWNAACSSSRPAVLLVPKGKTYLLKPTTLSGPCKSTIVLTVKGKLVAPRRRSAWSQKIWLVGVAAKPATGRRKGKGGTAVQHHLFFFLLLPLGILGCLGLLYTAQAEAKLDQKSFR